MKTCEHEMGPAGNERRCLRVNCHRGDHEVSRADAHRLDDLDYQADVLDVLRNIAASLSALPPVLNAIAGATYAGVGASLVRAGPHGEPLTLADLTKDDDHA